MSPVVPGTQAVALDPCSNWHWSMYQMRWLPGVVLVDEKGMATVVPDGAEPVTTTCCQAVLAVKSLFFWPLKCPWLSCHWIARRRGVAPVPWIWQESV